MHLNSQEKDIQFTAHISPAERLNPLYSTSMNNIPDVGKYRRASMITLPSEHNRYGFSASNNFNPTSVPLELQPPKSMSRRQSMSKGSKIYALRIASTPGIYHSWAVAKSLIDGCPGAKYKGFPTIKECMDFFWEQFPSCTFTINDNGDYIMNETEPVYEIIAKARQKKQRNSGISLVTDTSSFDPLDPQAKLLKSIIASNSNVSLELNAEQQQALNSVKEGENVFISGSRSTGKDVLLAHICHQIASENKNFHVTSASAITALNERVNYTMGWTGIGKALGTKKQILSKVRKNTQARKAWMETHVLIIKDITLLSAFTFDVMDYLAKEIRKNSSPFGGMQLILIGDLYDLSPAYNQTICCPKCGQAYRIDSQAHSEPIEIGTFVTCINESCLHKFLNTWLLYCFETPAWEELKCKYFKLNQNYIDDEKLSALIQAVSIPPPLSKTGMNLLLECCDSLEENSTIVCPLNEEAMNINDKKMKQVTGDPLKYEASDTVLNNFDFSSRAQQKEGLTDDIVHVKINTPVLILPEFGNTFIRGIVVGFTTLSSTEEADIIQAESKGIEAIEMTLSDWMSRNISFPRVKIDLTGKIKTITPRSFLVHSSRKAVAWRVQLPIRPAYAISLYKCQHMRLEQISISDKHDWKPGQLRSALNLAHTFKSISIQGYQNLSFEPDSRVIQLEHHAKCGEPMKSIPRNIVADAFDTHTLSLKRNSISSTFGSSKKRRDSKTSLNSPIIETLHQKSHLMTDPNFLRYQQLSHRRHSYAPLTSYQEQQYAWLSHQQPMIPSPLFHQVLQNNHMVATANPTQGLNILLDSQSQLFQSRLPMQESYHVNSAEQDSMTPKFNTPYLYTNLQDQTLQENNVNVLIKTEAEVMYDPFPNHTSFIEKKPIHNGQNSWEWNQQQ